MMLVLASASPRRAELLSQLGLSFGVHAVNIDESVQANESPYDYVLRLAEEKATAAQRQRGSALVLGSDTAVVVDREIYGKPRDYHDFLDTMNALSGRTHSVMSAVAVVSSDTVKTAVSVTEVHFRALHQAEIESYWKTGEPADKAGGYAIQGLGAAFIEQINGSYSGVMGLPIYETAEILRSFGVLIHQSASS